MKKGIKYLRIIIFILSVILIIFIACRIILIAKLENIKIFEAEIPYFKITLHTKYRSSFFNMIIWKPGMVSCKLHLEGKIKEYSYEKYDSDESIAIQFLDNEGFLVEEKRLKMEKFTRLVDSFGNVLGFLYLGNYEESPIIYKRINKIGVSYTCYFEIRKGENISDYLERMRKEKEKKKD